jgi:hypothetical protein
MSLPVKKIYVDSRFKTKDSVSDSNFKFEISQSLTLPKNSTCYIDDITIPHSWYNVNEKNNRLYIYANHGTDSTFNIIYIPVKNYNGATLAVALNTLFNSLPHSYYLSASFDINTSQLNIYTDSSNTGFKIYPDFELKKMYKDGGWNGPSYDINNLCSVNALIQNTNNFTKNYNNNLLYQTDFMNFNTIRNIYICSPNLCSLSVIGPRGGPANIVKKVPVSSDFGYVVYSGGSIAHDFIECSRQTWKTLEFTIEDVEGNVIDLNSNPVSFSIILSTINEDF